MDPVIQKAILLRCLFDRITFRENRNLVLTPGKLTFSRKNTYFANKFLSDAQIRASAEEGVGKAIPLPGFFNLN